LVALTEALEDARQQLEAKKREIHEMQQQFAEREDGLRQELDLKEGQRERLDRQVETQSERIVEQNEELAKLDARVSWLENTEDGQKSRSAAHENRFHELERFVQTVCDSYLVISDGDSYPESKRLLHAEAVRLSKGVPGLQDERHVTLQFTVNQAERIAEALHYGVYELDQYADGHGRDIDGVETHCDYLKDVEETLMGFVSGVRERMQQEQAHRQRDAAEEERQHVPDQNHDLRPKRQQRRGLSLGL
jgi:hypothetical protein